MLLNSVYEVTDFVEFLSKIKAFDPEKPLNNSGTITSNDACAIHVCVVNSDTMCVLVYALSLALYMPDYKLSLHVTALVIF